MMSEDTTNEAAAAQPAGAGPNSITVGRFSYDFDDDSLYGPRQYLEAQGDRILTEILGGNWPASFPYFLEGAMKAHPENAELWAVLVYLQTDFAGWAGMQQSMASFENAK